MITTDPVFYALAIPVVILFGISKGGFGGGLGILSVPILSLVISPLHAVAILLPVLCFIDLFGLWAYRGQWDHDNLKILVPASILGIIIGTLLFSFMSADFFRILLGGIAILFTLDYWTQGLRKIRPESSKPDLLKGGAAGITAGFTSFIAHSGGPPISMYLLPQRMHRTRFVATTVLLFTVINYVKLVPYTWLGLIHTDKLQTSAILIPFATAGFLAGVWLHKKVSDTIFYRVCYVLLFVVGIKLLMDGVSSLL